MGFLTELRARRDYVLGEYKNGKTTNKLAKEFGCNSGTIYHFLQECGIELQRKKKKDKLAHHHDKVVKMLEDNVCGSEIARRLGFSVCSTCKYIKKIGYSLDQHSSHREDKLVDHKEEIIKMYEDGMSMIEIAKIFKCSSASLSVMLNKNGVETRDSTIYSVNENYFDAIDTEDKSYTLGFMYTDGNVRGNMMRISLAEQDKYILERFTENMRWTGPLHYTKPKGENYQSTWTLSISRVKLAEALKSKGCIPNKTHILQFPTPDIVPESLMPHFIRGAFCGDGSLGCFGVEKIWAVQITGNLDFLDGIEKIMKDLGCSVHVSKRHLDRDDNIINLMIRGFKSCKPFLDYIYKDATIYLPRKYEKYQRFLRDYDERILQTGHRHLAA